MAVAINLKKIDEWFAKVEGWRVVQAPSEESAANQEVGQLPEVSLDDIKAIASEKCEWIEIEDMSDTPYAQKGFMHPEGLEIGWGNPVDAYKRKEGSGVIFFNAYRVAA